MLVAMLPVIGLTCYFPWHEEDAECMQCTGLSCWHQNWFVDMSQICIVTAVRLVSLCRRIPNLPVDQRFMEHPKFAAGLHMQRDVTRDHTAWASTRSVSGCSIWWGQSSDASGYKLHVATEFARTTQPSHGQVSRNSEVTMYSYSPVHQHAACKCSATPEGQSRDMIEEPGACIMTTAAAPLADVSDSEEQDCVLDDLRCGAGHPVSNLASLGIHLLHQPLARQYVKCNACRGVVQFMN